MARKAAVQKKTIEILPKGIEAGDLTGMVGANTTLTKAQRSKLEEMGFERAYGYMTFEIWLVEGSRRSERTEDWVIPTLHISNGRAGYVRRTYAVDMDGKGCRVGHGPHVLKQYRVIVRRQSFKRLLPFLRLLIDGQKNAHVVRDRISSRRMRSGGRFSW